MQFDPLFGLRVRLWWEGMLAISSWWREAMARFRGYNKYVRESNLCETYPTCWYHDLRFGLRWLFGTSLSWCTLLSRASIPRNLPPEIDSIQLWITIMTYSLTFQLTKTSLTKIRKIMPLYPEKMPSLAWTAHRFFGIYNLKGFIRSDSTYYVE